MKQFHYGSLSSVATLLHFNAVKENNNVGL